MQRVVVTGLGVVTALGNNLRANLSRTYISGRSGSVKLARSMRVGTLRR